MKEQSTKWAALANGYISDVTAVIHKFIVSILEETCPDDRVRGNLLADLVDDLIKKYKESMRQVEFLLHIQRKGTLMTLNDDLYEKVEENGERR